MGQPARGGPPMGGAGSSDRSQGRIPPPRRRYRDWSRVAAGRYWLPATLDTNVATSWASVPWMMPAGMTP